MDKINRRPITLTIAFIAALMALGATIAMGDGSTLAQKPAGQGKGSAQTQPGQAAPEAPIGTGFTYQGRLKDGVNPANGQYDFTFKLYDALSGGTQAGSTAAVNNKTVTEGLFTVVLDFGSNVFGGDARWLEIAVRQTGGGGFTTLSPRQPLTTVPYAMSLATGSTGAVISGTLPSPALSVTNTNGTGIRGESSASNGTGVYGISNTGLVAKGVAGYSANSIGVYGWSGGNLSAGVFGESTGSSSGVFGTSAGGHGVFGDSDGTNRAGVYGTHGGNGYGVEGESFTNYAAVYGHNSATNGTGIYGQATGTGSSSMGVYATSSNGYGVFATSGADGGSAVYGYNAFGNGVHGQSADTYESGVYGTNSYGIGVYGYSTGTGSNNFGVHGAASGTAFSRGISGYSASNIGTYGHGEGQARVGVYGSSNGDVSYGVYGRGAGNNAISVYGWGGFGVWAGYFDGDAYVAGTCYGGCLGASKIDHPLDPANKYLYHASVQSEDMMNIYSGNVTTDAKGEAVVTLPDWFEALNKDFRYQLTIMGDQFAQARVSSKIENNRFTIKTDKPSVEVSWQVTGIRHDAYSEQHPIPVEEEKEGDERGKYLHPTEHGQPENKGIDYERKQYAEEQDAHPQPQTPQAKP